MNRIITRIMNKMKSSSAGFSIVEIIITIAIMAILVGVLAPSVVGQVERSRESVCISNCNTLHKDFSNQLALEEFAGVEPLVRAYPAEDVTIISVFSVSCEEICPSTGVTTFTYDETTEELHCECSIHGTHY